MSTQAIETRHGARERYGARSSRWSSSPVSDVERANGVLPEARLEAGRHAALGVVQFTPPGSSCSVQFGKNLTSAAPGSAKAYLIVSDIEAAREELVAAGVEVSEVFHLGAGRPGQRSGSRASQLLLARLVQRSRRQQLAAAGDHDPASRARRRRPRLRSAPPATWRARCGARRPPTASTRSASAQADAELARLVRLLHGGGAGRDGAADVATRTFPGRRIRQRCRFLRVLV